MQLTPAEAAAAAELRRFLERTLEDMTRESLRIQPTPANVGTFVEIGNTIAGIEKLMNLLPR